MSLSLCNLFHQTPRIVFNFPRHQIIIGVGKTFFYHFLLPFGGIILIFNAICCVNPNPERLLDIVALQGIKIPQDIHKRRLFLAQRYLRFSLCHHNQKIFGVFAPQI